MEGPLERLPPTLLNPEAFRGRAVAAGLQNAG
jgi:hypothetical protein